MTEVILPDFTKRSHFVGQTYCDGKFAFSNDGSLKQSAVDKLHELRDGLALHIGAGAMFSLIDKHELWPILLDYDSAVISVQQAAEEAIVTNTSAAAAAAQLVTETARMLRVKPGAVEAELRKEASVDKQGKYHWLRHFDSVREAVIARPPIYVTGDIRDPKTPEILSELTARHGLIKFFNATNVHNHALQPGESMGFLRDFPLAQAPDFLGMYSMTETLVSTSHRVYTGLGRKYFTDIEYYIARTARSAPRPTYPAA